MKILTNKMNIFLILLYYKAVVLEKSIDTFMKPN